MAKEKLEGVLLCGYSNTPTKTIGVLDLDIEDIKKCGWRTDISPGFVATPGEHYLGSAERHHYPSDVILYVPDDDGYIRYKTNKPGELGKTVPVEISMEDFITENGGLDYSI